MHADDRAGHDAIDAEGAPVRARGTPGHQIPAAVGEHHPVRLDAAMAGLVVAVGVIQVQLQLVAAGAGQRGQQVGIHHRAGLVQGQHGGAQRVQAFAQTRWHHLFQLDQRGDRGVLDAADRAGDGGAQGDGRGQRFLVIQQQGRQCAAGTECVTAGHAAAGLDGVSQLAQSIDVAAQCARVHLHAFGQCAAGPVRPRLQQGQQ
ncbi:hypothetical protein D3C71_1143690 [compost metagenome]